MPLVYGGFFLSGFWAPINNINKLNIKIVNLDNNDISKGMAQDLSKTPIKIKAGSKQYEMNLKLSTIYKSEQEVQTATDKGKIDAAFTIPHGFQENIKKSLLNNIPTLVTQMIKDPNFIKALGTYDITKPKKIPLPILISFVSNIPTLDLPKLNFYNSYKNNFLTGELTNLVANTNSLKNAIVDNVFKDMSKAGSSLRQSIVDAINAKLNRLILPAGALQQIDKLINNVLTYLGDKGVNDNNALKKALSNFVNHQTVGGNNINSYGKGVSPYFYSIAIWAGMLVAVFIFKNRRTRDQRKNNTFLNYFSKTLIWIGTSWIQVTLLWFFIVLFWTVNSGFDARLFFSTYAYMLFLGMLFALIVQAISFSFRFAELGSLFVVILLITQLVSSSGTFPVEMQSKIFQWFSYIAPFTYSIATFREIMFHPSFIHILSLQWPILLFLLLVPISVFINYRYDKKDYLKHKQYGSYIIESDEE